MHGDSEKTIEQLNAAAPALGLQLSRCSALPISFVAWEGCGCREGARRRLTILAITLVTDKRYRRHSRAALRAELLRSEGRPGVPEASGVCTHTSLFELVV